MGSQRTARLYQDNFLDIASAKCRSSAGEFSKSAENIPRLLEDNQNFHYRKRSVSYETLMLLIKKNEEKPDESLPRMCRRNGAIEQPGVIVLKTKSVDSLIGDLFISIGNGSKLVPSDVRMNEKQGHSGLLLDKELRQRRNGVDDFTNNNARMDRTKLRVVVKKF